jgi:transcriptional regulator with XRE-family HTH domain
MLGRKLFQLRKKRGKTQKAVAQCVGIARTTYALYEQNRKIPDLDILEKIAKCLDVKVEELIRQAREEEKEKEKPKPKEPKKIDLEKLIEKLKASSLTFDGKPVSLEQKKLIIALFHTMIETIVKKGEKEAED